MANGQPHTHEVRIARRYQLINRGPLQVTYGDTTATVRPWWCFFGPCVDYHKPTERRVRRAIRKAIRKHDAGSQRYESDRAAVEAAKRLASEVNSNLRQDEWAS